MELSGFTDYERWGSLICHKERDKCNISFANPCDSNMDVPC